MARELAEVHSCDPQDNLDPSSGFVVKAAEADNLSKKHDKKMFQVQVEDPAHQLLNGNHLSPEVAQRSD